MPNIFISYVHENQDKAEKLSEALRSYDMEVWLDRDSISPGMRWRDAIRQAIKNGAYFIACFSVEYENRDKSYMNEELMLAIDELCQYSPDRPWFIPVLFSKCNVPAFSIGGGQTLLDFQWVDLYSDWTSGFQKLLRVLNSDHIEFLKELIDNHGYSHHANLAYLDLKSSVASKQTYLETVHELKQKYGILYDPLRLYRS